MKLGVDDIIKITWSAIVSLLNPGGRKEELPKRDSSRYPKIYVFRHGETYDNKNRVFSGWRDSELTEKGKKQALALHKKLAGKKIDVCIVSRLSRSRDTANIIFRGRKIRFELDDRIIERDYGDISGKSKEKLMKEDLVRAVKYRRFYDFPPPNGESLKDVGKRVFPFCKDLIERIRKTGENIAVSCHGNSMKMIRFYFEKLELVEAIIQENPLGNDYAQYVVTPRKILVAR